VYVSGAISSRSGWDFIADKSKFLTWVALFLINGDMAECYKNTDYIFTFAGICIYWNVFDSSTRKLNLHIDIIPRATKFTFK
jgi:hypothetical protein